MWGRAAWDFTVYSILLLRRFETRDPLYKKLLPLKVTVLLLSLTEKKEIKLVIHSKDVMRIWVQGVLILGIQWAQKKSIKFLNDQ